MIDRVRTLLLWLYHNQQLMGWLTAGGTIGAVIVALFKEDIIRFIRRPDVSIEYDIGEPYNRTVFSPIYNKPRIKSQYTRLKINNSGKETAKGVYVRLIDIKKIREQTIDSRPSFDPIALHWVGSRITRVLPKNVGILTPFERLVFEKSINIGPKDFEYVDLFYINRNSDKIMFISNNMYIDSKRGIHLSHKRDTYDLILYICGKNFEPIKYRIRILDDKSKPFDTQQKLVVQPIGNNPFYELIAGLKAKFK